MHNRRSGRARSSSRGWAKAGTGPSGAALPVLPLCYHLIMAVRKKRSVSIPPDLDAQIEAAAAELGVTYSAWLAATARKEFTIRAGLEAVAEFEREQGAFSLEEIAEAEQWAREALERSTIRSSRRRRTA
jgi:hypothetical protein